MNEPMDDLGPEEKEMLGERGGSLKALRTQHADCPRPEVLLALQTGTLPPETSKRIMAHTEKCNFCQILLTDLASEELLSATAEEENRVREWVLSATKPEIKNAKAGAGFRSMWFWTAIPATALAGAAIVLLVWVRLHQTEPPRSVPVAVVQPPKPIAPPELQWEKLPIRLQAGSVLIWRGKPRNAQERYASELMSALAFYKDDRFTEAAESLEKVVKDFPNGVEGLLYLGISDLKLERNTNAIAPLRAAQLAGPEQFRDDATWYLAMALLRVGETQACLAELQKLCGGKSSYVSQACAAIKELSSP